MLKVAVHQDEVRFGRSVRIGFERTLRLPAGGREYALPHGLDTFPLYRVKDYADRVPAAWRKSGGAFVPVYQGEAIWISFSGRWWKPNAVKIGFGGTNAVSGKAWRDGMSAAPQDYIVVPDQPWLDGIHSGKGAVRQFIAPPLESLAVVVAADVGAHEEHVIQLVVFEPKVGCFPNAPPQDRVYSDAQSHGLSFRPTGGGPAGSEKKRRICRDEHGVDVWDQDNHGRVLVHIVNSRLFREITGEAPPPSPISADHYAKYGVPWLDLYDEHDR